MLLHLIYGPTCSGKTDMAIQIAQETGWPVVALDRVQCCPQIATGSGRPLESELQSTRRIYLDSRPSPRASLTLRVPIVDSYSKWIGGSPKRVLFSRAGRFRFSIAWLKVRFGDRVFNGMSSGYVLGIRTPFSPEPSNALRKCLPSGKIALVVGGVGGTLELPCRSTDFGRYRRISLRNSFCARTRSRNQPVAKY